jgi:hypothetical protein
VKKKDRKMIYVERSMEIIDKFLEKENVWFRNYREI